MAKKIVAFVPAKGHSERIQNKNLRILDGEYLFKRKLKQLLNCSLISEVYLDTDSDDIIRLSQDLPVKHIKRPAHLANNQTDGHALFAFECAQVEADLYLQCLCTSPFIDEDTIRRALIALNDNRHCDSLVGIRRDKQYLWDENGPLYDRTHIPNSVDLKDSIIETMGLYMVKANGHAVQYRYGQKPYLFELNIRESLDVNWPEDLELAEQVCLGERTQTILARATLKRYLSSAILADVAKELGLNVILPNTIRPFTSNHIIFGQAKTLTIRKIQQKEEWVGIYDALNSYSFIRPGDVIVVKNPIEEHAYFGELNANIALRSGAVGAVIDGYTRDTSEVSSLNFPLFAQGSSCRDVKYEGTMEAMNAPIQIGSVMVKNGDYVFGDDNGVVVVPQEKWPMVIEAVWHAIDKEWHVKKAIAMGFEPQDILKRIGTF